MRERIEVKEERVFFLSFFRPPSCFPFLSDRKERVREIDRKRERRERERAQRERERERRER